MVKQDICALIASSIIGAFTVSLGVLFCNVLIFDGILIENTQINQAASFSALLKNNTRIDWPIQSCRYYLIPFSIQAVSIIPVMTIFMLHVNVRYKNWMHATVMRREFLETNAKKILTAHIVSLGLYFALAIYSSYTWLHCVEFLGLSNLTYRWYLHFLWCVLFPLYAIPLAFQCAKRTELSIVENQANQPVQLMPSGSNPPYVINI